MLPALLPVVASHTTPTSEARHQYSAGVRRRALSIVHSLVVMLASTLGDDPRASAALAPLLAPWLPQLTAALREPTSGHVRPGLTLENVHQRLRSAAAVPHQRLCALPRPDTPKLLLVWLLMVLVPGYD